jgi:hypothetical protein
MFEEELALKYREPKKDKDPPKGNPAINIPKPEKTGYQCVEYKKCNPFDINCDPCVTAEDKYRHGFRFSQKRN